MGSGGEAERVVGWVVVQALGEGYQLSMRMQVQTTKEDLERALKDAAELAPKYAYATAQAEGYWGGLTFVTHPCRSEKEAAWVYDALPGKRLPAKLVNKAAKVLQAQGIQAESMRELEGVESEQQQ